MRREVVQRRDSAGAEPLLRRLVGWQAGPRGYGLESTSAAVDDSLDLGHGELPADGHGRDLPLASGIGHFRED
jgi:hypothetical protein